MTLTDMQQPHNFFLRFMDPFGDEGQERAIVPVDMFQRVQVFPAQNRGDYGQHIPIPEKRSIHQQPGGPSVPADEGVDKNKPLVKTGGKPYRMEIVPAVGSPGNLPEVK